MGNKFEKFISFRIALFKFLMAFFIAGGSLLILVGLSQIFTVKAPSGIIQFFTVMIGQVSFFSGLLFLLCLPIAGFYWLAVRKGLPKMTAVEKKKTKIWFFVGLAFATAAIIFFSIVNSLHLGARTCDNVECFLAKANVCTAVKWQTTDSAGMKWLFYSSPYCRFDKKLVAITGNESSGMKKVLEGQGLTCDYEQNQFDSQWVNSLIFNLEPCHGDLKESIARLLLLL
ncbi:MAG: hypothetical protein WC702_04800 [Patescibacteria group bacterium]|jgi:hypothetical protein